MCVLKEVLLRFEPATEVLPTIEAAARVSVAAESLRLNGRLRLRVRGESMLPSLWPGDVVEFSRCALSEVGPGEIVLAMRDGRFFVHRFVGRVQPNTFLLRGDSMPAADLPFAAEAFLGRLVAKSGLPGARPVPRLQPWTGLFGFLMCHCAPVRRLALRIHARRANSAAQIPADGANVHIMDYGVS